MKAACVDAAQAFLGRGLSPTETRGLEDRVKLQMTLLARKDPAAWRALSAQDRVAQAAQAAAQDMLGEVKKQQQRVALTIAAHDRVENFLATQKLVKPGDKLRAVSQLLDFDTKGGGFTSVASWTKALQEETFSHLIKTFESVSPKFFGLFENKEGVRALIKELWGEDSGVPEAKAGAVAFRKSMDELRDRANAAGSDIGKLDEWHYPQHHSQERIANAGLDKWANDTLPLLGRDKYINMDGTRMTDEQMRGLFAKAFDSIITDGMNKQTPGPNPGYGLIANRNAHSRVIFFKDSDSYLRYQGMYGEKNLWSTMTDHVRRVARDTALAEVLGPNPDHVFGVFNDKAHLEEVRANPTESSKLKKLATFNEALFDYVAGRQQVVSQTLADRFQAFRNFQTAAKLGKVVITALTDESGMAATAFANKVPWSAAFMRELRTLNPVNHADRAVAEQAGLGLNSMVGGLNRFGMEEFGASWTGKMANWVLHATGAERMWDARRQGLGSVIMSYVGKMTRDVKNFADLNPTDHGVLARKGVTEADWQVWRKAQTEDWGAGAHSVLTPKTIAAIPDSDIDHAIAPRIQEIKDEATRRIDALSTQDAQDQGWMAKRQTDLQNWIQRARERLSERSEKSDAKTQDKLKAISGRLQGLYDRIDTAGAYFKDTDANQVGMAELRNAAQKEGRNQAAIDQVATRVKQAMRDTSALKEGLDRDFREKFTAKEHEIEQLISSGDEGKVAFALKRFNELFDDANASLTDRRHGADEKLTKQIDASVAKVNALRKQIDDADKLWERANASRPSFSQLRAQGVREGRARESAKELTARIREIKAEFESSKEEAVNDLANQFASKQKEFSEYSAKVSERIQRRQFVANSIRDSLQPQIEAARADARRHATTQLMAHILEEAGMGAMDTGPRQRVAMTFGTQKGTVGGELLRSVMLFKSFAFSMMTKHWSRASSMPTAASKWGYMSRLIVAGTVMAAVGNEIRNLISGKNPSNVLDPKFWGAALLRGGGLGFYGDFLYDQVNGNDNSLAAAMGGPMLTTAEDIWNVTGAAAFKHAKGERVDEGAKLIRFAKQNIPGLNMWYTQAAMDHLLWNDMQEAVSPGYLDRMQTKAYDQKGTSWYWSPDDGLPKASPDFAQMWQPDKAAETFANARDAVVDKIH